LNDRNLWRVVLTGFLTFLGLAIVITFTLGDYQLLQAANSTIFTPRPNAYEFTNRMVTENIPANSSIGVVSKWSLRDYPFFGERFTRRVTLAIPDDQSILPRIDTGPFRRDFMDSDYLLTSDQGSPAIVDDVINEFDMLSDDGDNSLWIRKTLNSTTACDGQRWPFTDFFQSSPDEICPEFPIVSPGSPGDTYKGVSPQDGRFMPAISLGSNSKLHFGLLVKGSAEYDFSIEISPGERGYDKSLQLIITDSDSQARVFYAPFYNMSSLHFRIPLEPGTYKLAIGLSKGPRSMPAQILNMQVWRLGFTPKPVTLPYR
jgi:hypothetical protein